MTFSGMLGVRPLSSPDLGYHLDYGEQFLDTLRPVDHNPFIYTLPSPAEPNKPQPGPGCWYDSQGRYRFPNANWLTQAIMAQVHRWGGFSGLCALQIGLTVLLFALCLMTLLSLRLPLPIAAVGVLLVAMTSYERLLLRPELFGYVVLAAQLYLLVRGRASYCTAAGLVILQLLMVNLHSYFLLGLFLTGCFLGEATLRRLVMAKNTPRQTTSTLGGGADSHVLLPIKWLSIVFALQVAMCFVNPWTWRLAILPIQTVLYISRHGINLGSPTDAGTHPWAVIGEFYKPFVFWNSHATIAYVVVLALSATAAIAAFFRRRWATLAILLGMTAMSLSMRRNIAPGAIVLVPVATALLWPLTNARWFSRLASPRVWLPKVGLGGLIGIELLLIVLVLTQQFYNIDRLPTRFGIGYSPVEVPIGASAWLSEHKPVGRIWADYNDSSNIHYFPSFRPDVPVVTNTWAYPPDVMQAVLQYTRGERPFEQAVNDYSLQVVALFLDPASTPLVQYLLHDQRWRLVYVDIVHVIFVRADGPNAELARRCAITPENFDCDAFQRHLLRVDSMESFSMWVGGSTLFTLAKAWDTPAETAPQPAWYRPTIRFLERAVALDGSHSRRWNTLGICYARQGNIRLRSGDRGGLTDIQKAQEYFENALRLEPASSEASINLGLARRDIARWR